jgi:hypothetical protein
LPTVAILQEIDVGCQGFSCKFSGFHQEEYARRWQVGGKFVPLGPRTIFLGVLNREPTNPLFARALKALKS